MLLNLVKNFKVPVSNIVIIALVFFAVLHSESYWQAKHELIEQLMYGLLIITVVFSSYFSRSRFAFLALLWVLFSLTLAENLPWSPWVLAHDKWLMLFGAFVFSLLSLIKDRGVISLHGINRLLLISCCGILAWSWLWAAVFIIKYSQQHGLPVQWAAYIELELPLLLTALLLTWQSLKSQSLLVAALLVSFLVWCFHHYQLLSLPWHITLTILAVHYLLIVIIDSYFLAYRDELTTLPSRRALNQLALSLGRKYTVAMLDIDHFKKFNDTYGHDIGDQVLKLVASKIGQVKDGGKAFRYGGEEFTIVFPRKNTEQALHALESVRQTIADYAITIRHPQRETKQARGQKKSDLKKVSVTISIGVSTKEKKQNFEQTLKIADQALYRAKKNGRNNVSC